MDAGVKIGSITAEPGGKSDSPAKIKQAAAQFEALLIQEMLKTAGSAANGGSLGDTEDQNSALTDLGQQQFAQALASNGGLGLAKMVVEGLNTHAHR